MSAPSVLRPGQVLPRSLAEISTAVAGLAEISIVSNSGNISHITGVTQSSTSVMAGDLYVAVAGSRFHGARFIPQAREAGAVAVLTDFEGLEAAQAAGLPALVTTDPRALAGEVASFIYGNPSAALTLVGITGTNGKTTTSYLVEAGLRAAGYRTGIIGTVETRLADLTIPSTHTTPEAPELQALLALAVEQGVNALVMEVSSHALALSRVVGTRFTVGAFTNLSVDHLDFHTDLEDYFTAKAKLFDGRCDYEIVNIDDEYGRRLVGPNTIKVSTDTSSSQSIPADWWVSDVRQQQFGQHFFIHSTEGSKTEAFVALLGDFNIDNAALAIATLATLDIPLSDAVRGVGQALGVPGRMERVTPKAPVLAIVDYAHSPDGVIKALAALREITTGRLICVLGCGGDRDATKRPAMGRAAVEGADVFIATDDNPRSEDPKMIRQQMLADIVGSPLHNASRAQIIEVEGRREAIYEAVRNSQPGDTIALLGKGHEQGQQIGNVLYPFDDRQVLAAAVNEVFG